MDWLRNGNPMRISLDLSSFLQLSLRFFSGERLKAALRTQFFLELALVSQNGISLSAVHRHGWPRHQPSAVDARMAAHGGKIGDGSLPRRPCVDEQPVRADLPRVSPEVSSNAFNSFSRPKVDLWRRSFFSTLPSCPRQDRKSRNAYLSRPRIFLKDGTYTLSTSIRDPKSS
ncbi:hypothetical protein TGP89_419540 [Toxoplasma gondii p89]|uniref:Uncharacterized protein n=1 Tax=Toxoplasma gondii p89 TaxID=943119 RepID=A0A086KAB3_TOXGO|nr:hypothetical protein TGP89_419540 [Toxoplasma gondii p89]